MADLRKAAETLLKALEEDEPLRYATRWDGFLKDEIQTLRQALNVDAVNISQERVDKTTKRKHEWVGLTDEEINLIYAQPQTHAGQYAKSIEAKLKEKNT